MALLQRLCVSLVLLVPALAQAAFLGNPGNGLSYSGIGVVSGWKCTANGPLTVRFDGGNPLPLLYGSERPDVRDAGKCSDTAVGFVAIWNWGNLDAGTHTAAVYDNGVEFARSTFEVTTAGAGFVRGASAQVMVPDFPALGETTTLEWNEGTQHLEIVTSPRLLTTPPSTPLTSRANFENPGHGSPLSGIGVISGWKCEAEGALTVRFDDGDSIPLMYGSERSDTARECGDTDNGFVTIWNYAELGDGVHSAKVYDNGVLFAESTFEVGSTGETFLRGVRAQITVENFPACGESTTFEWNQGTQHMEIAPPSPNTAARADVAQANTVMPSSNATQESPDGNAAHCVSMDFEEECRQTGGCPTPSYKLAVRNNCDRDIDVAICFNFDGGGGLHCGYYVETFGRYFAPTLLYPSISPDSSWSPTLPYPPHYLYILQNPEYGACYSLYRDAVDLVDHGDGTYSCRYDGRVWSTTATVVGIGSPSNTNVCERTPEVRDAIVQALSARSCDSLTAEDLARIKSLSLSGQGITALKRGDFDWLSNLEALYLSNNALTTLPKDIFAGLTSLRQLSLDSNKLTSLTADLFADLSLEALYLSNNALTTLPEDIFAGLTSLRQLSLDSNKLTSLTPDLFAGLSSLEELNLSGNEIATLPAGVFSDLFSLATLDLSQNALTMLPAGIFDDLSLEELDLRFNPGAPFTATLEPFLVAYTARTASGLATATIRVKIAAGSPSPEGGAPMPVPLPFEVTGIWLQAEGGTISPWTGTISKAEATISTGTGSTEAFKVTQTGTGPVTVELFAKDLLSFGGTIVWGGSVQLELGRPLVLFEGGCNGGDGS